MELYREKLSERRDVMEAGPAGRSPWVARKTPVLKIVMAVWHDPRERTLERRSRPKSSRCCLSWWSKADQVTPRARSIAIIDPNDEP